MSQITREQIKELINLRLKDIEMENYDQCIEDVDDAIIRWLLIIDKRINNKN